MLMSVRAVIPRSPKTMLIRPLPIVAARRASRPVAAAATAAATRSTARRGRSRGDIAGVYINCPARSRLPELQSWAAGPEGGRARARMRFPTFQGAPCAAISDDSRCRLQHAVLGGGADLDVPTLGLRLDVRRAGDHC